MHHGLNLDAHLQAWMCGSLSQLSNRGWSGDIIADHKLELFNLQSVVRITCLVRDVYSYSTSIPVSPIRCVGQRSLLVAVGLVLFSGRGYWQAIIWAHNSGIV